MNKKFNRISALLKCPSCDMVTKCGKCAYHLLSDSGFRLCVANPPEIQGTILHWFNSWPCMFFGSFWVITWTTDTLKKVVCMQKQTDLALVQLSRSFQERTLKLVFWFLHTVWDAIPEKPWSWIESQNPLNYLWTNSVAGYLYRGWVRWLWKETNNDNGKRLLLNKCHIVVLKHCWDDIWFGPLCC